MHHLGIPSASEEEKANGWTLSIEWLTAINFAAGVLNDGKEPGLEVAEAVVLAAYAMLSLGDTGKRAGDVGAGMREVIKKSTRGK